MKFNLTKHIAYLMLALPMIFISQSCKSDTDDLIDIPSSITMKGYSLYPLFNTNDLDEEVLVIPSLMSGITSTSSNENVAYVTGSFIFAEEVGETRIELLKDGKSIRTIDVTVTPEFELTVKVGERVDLNKTLPDDRKATHGYRIVEGWGNVELNNMYTITGVKPGYAILYGTRPDVHCSVGVTVVE